MWNNRITSKAECFFKKKHLNLGGQIDFENVSHKTNTLITDHSLAYISEGDLKIWGWFQIMGGCPHLQKALPKAIATFHISATRHIPFLKVIFHLIYWKVPCVIPHHNAQNWKTKQNTKMYQSG